MWAGIWARFGPQRSTFSTLHCTALHPLHCTVYFFYTLLHNIAHPTLNFTLCLYCTALQSTTQQKLHHTALLHTAPHRITPTLHHTALPHTSPHSTTPHCTTHHYPTLHYFHLCCTALHLTSQGKPAQFSRPDRPSER